MEENQKCELQLYRMKKEDIPAFAHALAVCFQDYPLYNYFCGHRGYNIDHICGFFEMAIRSNNETIGLATSNNLEGVAILEPPMQERIGILGYIKAGALGVLKEMGAGAMVRMLRFEDFADAIKKKYQTEKCWYLYQLGVLPQYRSKGYTSALMRPIFEQFDAQGQDCYLETMLLKNVEIYKHYGFELMESTPIPNTDITLYAMLRKGKYSQA